MAQSSEIYNEIQSLLGQINPRLDALPDADTYYKNKVNEAYNYNMPAIQNAAKLEGEMYSLPGNLMSEYDTEFGGKTGVSSNQRINSILSRLGNQGALASTAWGLVDQSGARMDELAKTLSNQYRTGIEADQAKLSPLMSIWDRMYSEEQANARARRSGGSSYVSPWGNIEIEDETPTGVPNNGDKEKAINTATGSNSFKPGNVVKDIAKSTALSLADQYLGDTKAGKAYKKGKSIYEKGKNIYNTGTGS